MARLTNIQLFCILLVTLTVTPYQVMAKMLAMILAQHGWMAILGSVLPGLLLVWIYYYLLTNSSRPFPGMLEEHLGPVLGKIIGFVYIWAFFLVVVISLVLFANFFLSNVLPSMPISILLIFVILPTFYALRTGLEATARVVELIVLTAYPLAMLLLLFGLGPETDWSRLLPLSHFDIAALGNGVWLVSSYISLMIVVLTLGPFCHQPRQLWRWMLAVYGMFLFSTLAAVIIPIVAYGPVLTSIQTFPIFNIARATDAANFIHNIEIIMVSVVMPGVFSILAIFWFVTCYSAQQVFGLQDYRILVGPTAIMAGVSAVLLVPNIHFLYIMLQQLFPWIFMFLFAILPAFLVPVIWLKLRRRQESDSKNGAAPQK
ncbi:MAG: GerAB/ArcD/ProY family transporter [Syntrophomonas sp.]|nr:GerAB/ArcD/ProY family transporter [Syntrophomonas sp.]